MGSQRRLFNLLALLVVVTLLAVACERPLPGTPDDANQNGVTDPNVGGGIDGTDDGTTDPDDTDNGDSSGDGSGDNIDDASGDDTQGGDDQSGDDAGDGNNDSGDNADDNIGDDNADDSAGDDATDDNDSDDSAGDDSSDDNDAGDDSGSDSDGDNADITIPETHTVVAGENLYRIGLKYGISWVAIANENNLANPNVLTVGQVLKLPGASGSDPTPTPSPQTETTYIVRSGDNLFKIGLRFGISWVQIAEANGLVNPNLIKVGDELKIPVDTPGPAPQFSHVVKRGETLFLISLQYGVAWPTIAEANDLTSPYVIYVGQTLEIPGSE